MMILRVFHGTGSYAYKDIDNTFFITKSYGGRKSIQFDIPIKHPLYPYLSEETQLEYDGQYYLIKGVNERSGAGICTINAELDFTGLENKVYTSKTWNTASFDSFTNDILSGTGWRIINAELISKRTTTEAKDNTPLELLEKSTNATSYGTCYEFDTKKRLITCIKPENNTSPTGCYFSDELNLSELTMKGNSSGLVTKLYPIGKDGLTIAAVNNGVPYIENHSYTDKVVCKVWHDERYTDAQSLKDDAVVKLEAMANPERSYTCKVTDLAKTNPEIYGIILAFKLYDVITLIDRIRKSRLDHRIVEVREYPADHSLDTVTLSSVAARVTGKLTEMNNRLTELDAQQLHDRTKINEIKQDLDTTVLHISESWGKSENSSVITQTADGLYLEVSKIIGSDQWSTKVRQSSNDIRIAWNNLSEYIKLEGAQLNIYDGTNKLISFNSNGEDVYYGTYKVGNVGAVKWEATSTQRGVAFNLEHDAAFMSWGYRFLSSSNSYAPVLLYASQDLKDRSGNIDYKSGTLHIDSDMDVHNKIMEKVKLKDWNFDGGSITGTFSGIRLTAVNPDGSFSYKPFSLTFNNGILQNASW